MKQYYDFEPIDESLPLGERLRIARCRRNMKPDCCIYPDKHRCKGCEHNVVPELSDGGCRLWHEKSEH